MSVEDLLKSRHCVRAFLEKPVPESLLTQILDAARFSPSGANTQPWQVVVLSGAAKSRLSDALTQTFENGEAARPDYHYYPDEWQAPYLDRRRQCGLQLYRSLQITRHDKAARQAQWAANYRAFDAPVMLLFLMDASLQTGSYLDYGMFIQSVMLAALEQGLGSCPQAALAEYPDIVREQLQLDHNTRVIAGMAMGFADTQAPVNQYRTEREPVANFCRFIKE